MFHRITVTCNCRDDSSSTETWRMRVKTTVASLKVPPRIITPKGGKGGIRKGSRTQQNGETVDRLREIIIKNVIKIDSRIDI